MGACVAGGVYDKVECMAEGMHGVAGETATAADGTHPTGMHSCKLFNQENPIKSRTNGKGANCKGGGAFERWDGWTCTQFFMRYAGTGPLQTVCDHHMLNFFYEISHRA